MPPSVFPYHVEQHLKQVKRDLDVIEFQVNAIKKSNEKYDKPWRQNAKISKTTNTVKGDAIKKSTAPVNKRSKILPSSSNTVPKSGNKENITKSQPRTISLENDNRNACICNTGGLPCVGQVSTRICSKNHVHHTIRIPASAVPGQHPVQQLEDNSSQRTWREALTQQCNKKVADVVADKAPRAPSPNPVHRKDANRVMVEQLEMLQREVRSAREEKDRARREAALAKLALSKFEAIVEAQTATRDNHQRSIQLLESRIRELILKERHETAVKVVEEVAQWQSTGTSTPMSGSTTSSQRFRTSSPARSDNSDHDSHTSWHELSSIQSLTFNTL